MRRTFRRIADSVPVLRTFHLRVEQLESRSMLAADFGDAVDDMAFDDSWQSSDWWTFDDSAYAGFDTSGDDVQWPTPWEPVDVRIQFVVSDAAWATYSYSIAFDGSVLGVSVMASYDEPTVASFVAAHGDDVDARIYDFGGGWSIDNFPIDLAPPVPGSEDAWDGAVEDDAFGSQTDDVGEAETTDVGGDSWSQDTGSGIEDVSSVDVADDPPVIVVGVTPADDAAGGSVVIVTSDEPTSAGDTEATEESGGGWDEGNGDETLVDIVVPVDDDDQPSAESGDGYEQSDAGDEFEVEVGGVDVGAVDDVAATDPAGDDAAVTPAETVMDVVIAETVAGATGQTSSPAVAPRATAFVDTRMLFAMATMMSGGVPETGTPATPFGFGRRRR